MSLYKIVAKNTPPHRKPLNPQYQQLIALRDSLTEFTYDPDKGITFVGLFKLFEGIFAVDCAALEDKMKDRFLLHKLTVHEDSATESCGRNLGPQFDGEGFFESALRVTVK
ncbi:hypothetical protein M514_00572 [Trichuris suis]|uniref:DUF7083 domain-containing protein n=1 Tax=Trichuris suis TaxID=68888 RepID=A0A085MMA0_9BILA|nr:hypothetical protein M513_00572 [Trichuris suis]KFD61251.1 hypothetical protein M514_00572 [Trichuris suis]